MRRIVGFIVAGGAILCLGNVLVADPIAVAGATPDAACVPIPALPDTREGDPATHETVTVHHWLEGDLEVSQKVPPADFSPRTATASQLSFYDLPPRPTNPAGAAEWADEFSAQHWRENVNLGPTDICQYPSANATADAGDPGATSGTTRNWAGYVDHDTSNGNYHYVHGEITSVPSFSHCGVSGTEDGHVDWVGIGGYGRGHGLIQNGIASTAGTSLAPYAWYELVPTSGTSGHDTRITSVDLAIHTNDDVKFTTIYDHTVTPNLVHFSWHNITTGLDTPLDVTGTDVQGNLSDYYDGATAEAVDERPSSSGSYEQNRQHDNVVWSNVQSSKNVDGSNPNGIRNGAWSIAMQNSSTSNQLEHPTAGSTNQDFTSHWDNCGTVDAK